MRVLKRVKEKDSVDDTTGISWTSRNTNVRSMHLKERFILGGKGWMAAEKQRSEWRLTL
jgi:hypothetical protein